MADFGPFSVDPVKITGLGSASFAPLVTSLLSAELALAGMTGTTLESTYIQNASDGGVDAGLRRAIATTWIPAGDSAWQFKAGDLPPGKCKTELLGASEALAILRAGGKYRLVLGVSLASALIKSRRNALRDQAKALGIIIEDDTFEVITADQLATWAEEHPAIAINPLLGGIGTSALTFVDWAQSNRHTTKWASSARRDLVLEQLRTVVAGGGQVDVHIEGVSGVGKTRLVLEALRGQAYEDLVVYIPAADQFYAPLMNHLIRQGRTAVIVIDECDRKQHEIFAGVLAAGSATRLITIGEPGALSTLRSPMVVLPGLDDDAMRDLLSANEPSLWPEARRVVIDVAAGNVDYALKASSAIGRNPSSAGTLITGEDVRTFITNELPGGELFLACSILALFSRFGYDRDVSGELDVIASGLGIPKASLKTAAVALQDLGLLSRQGRYRSVGPYPVAVYLAARGWDEFGELLISNLVPSLNDDMLERLFRRAADIGEFDVTSPAVRRIMDNDGPLSSFDAVREGNARLLTHFAVMAPLAVAGRLGAMLDSATDEDLEGLVPIRRDLVWTLEKLAWHSRTFDRAADSLLRLSLVETETWANNATGTWINLFGTMLPATAASPEARMSYLVAVATSADERKRALAVDAADKALEFGGSIIVSGEMQGGAVVEPRGTPKTLDSAWNYQNGAIDILRKLADDPAVTVAAPALKALISSIPPAVEIEAVRTHLGQALATLKAEGLRRARVEITGLISMLEHIEDTDFRRPALEKLFQALPPETSDEHLWLISHLRSWDLEPGQLREQIHSAALTSDDPVERLIELVEEPGELVAAFDVGWVLARISDGRSAIPRLVAQIDAPNSPALIGYLWSKVGSGEESAFDDFIDGSELTPMQKLTLTTRGNLTARAQERTGSLLSEVSVAQGARSMFGWLRGASEDNLAQLVNTWLDRIRDQEDYNAVVDFLASQFYSRSETLPLIDAMIETLLRRRAQFPDLGKDAYDWSRLAKRLLEVDPMTLVVTFADLIDLDALKPFPFSPESKVLQGAVKTGGADAWSLLMDRIHAGSWRLTMSTQGWLGIAVDVSIARAWVDGDLDKARTLASVASIGDSSVSDVGRFLLTNFGDDDRVPASLAGEFLSGSWTGNESDRISRQIQQLATWAKAEGESQAVKAWAQKVLVGLEQDRAYTLEREAERGW